MRRRFRRRRRAIGGRLGDLVHILSRRVSRRKTVPIMPLARVTERELSGPSVFDPDTDRRPSGRRAGDQDPFPASRTIGTVLLEGVESRSLDIAGPQRHVDLSVVLAHGQTFRSAGRRVLDVLIFPAGRLRASGRWPTPAPRQGRTGWGQR